MMSIELGFRILNEIEAEVPKAASWMLHNGSKASVVILASAARMESLAILRLQLCGRSALLMPMQPKYFYFLQRAGVYHLFTADLPHMFVAITKWVDAGHATTVDKLTVALAVGGCLHLLIRWRLDRQSLVGVQQGVERDRRHRRLLERPLLAGAGAEAEARDERAERIGGAE